jgi:hypothetical protein
MFHKHLGFGVEPFVTTYYVESQWIELDMTWLQKHVL